MLHCIALLRSGASESVLKAVQLMRPILVALQLEDAAAAAVAATGGEGGGGATGAPITVEAPAPTGAVALETETGKREVDVFLLRQRVRLAHEMGVQGMKTQCEKMLAAVDERLRIMTFLEATPKERMCQAMGAAYEAASNPVKALMAYQKALEIDSNHPLTLSRQCALARVCSQAMLPPASMLLLLLLLPLL